MDLFGSIGSTFLEGGSEADILGISSLFGDSIGFPDVADFVGTLGDTVGPAASLLNLLKAGTGAASGVFGGGGGGDSKGFVPQKNPQLEESKRFQYGLVRSQVSERERSKVGDRGNNHSRVILNQLFKDNESGIRAFGSQLAAVAAKSGTRS